MTGLATENLITMAIRTTSPRPGNARPARSIFLETGLAAHSSRASAGLWQDQDELSCLVVDATSAVLCASRTMTRLLDHPETHRALNQENVKNLELMEKKQLCVPLKAGGLKAVRPVPEAVRLKELARLPAQEVQETLAVGPRPSPRGAGPI